MVRQEDAVLVLFRMREVVLRSSLSGNTLMMQPSCLAVYSRMACGALRSGDSTHLFVSSIPVCAAFALRSGEGSIFQRDGKIGNVQPVAFLRVGAVQKAEAAVPPFHGRRVIHDKDGALTEIKIRVEFFLAGFHQLAQRDILRFKIRCQPDAFDVDFYFSVAVHIVGRGFQFRFQLGQKRRVWVRTAHHGHRIVRFHLRDPAPHKIPDGQHRRRDEHDVIPVIMPPVGPGFGGGQLPGFVRDQILGPDVAFVAVGCHGSVLFWCCFIYNSTNSRTVRTIREFVHALFTRGCRLL